MRQEFSSIPWWAMQTNPIIRFVGYYGWHVSLLPTLRRLERIQLAFMRGVDRLRQNFKPVFSNQQSADNALPDFDSTTSGHSLADEYESFQ